ncbi:MAG: hypothetical protein DI538_31435, partial [Azospira oryzae]
MDFEGNIVSLVSVILPTYNRAGLISRAIKSVLRQSYANWELIIIDDGSSDETARVVEQYLTDSRIKYLYKANSGAGDSRNFGLIKAKGDWITFLDSDDEFHEDKIKHQLETALATGSKFIVCGSVYFKDGVEFRKKIPSQKPNLKYALLNKEASTGVSTPIYFIASKLLKSNSIQFDASLPAFQDWDLLYQIADITNYEVVKEHLYTVHFQRAGRVHSMKNVLLAHRLLLCKYQYDFAGDLEAKRKWVGM